jgi:hypothetical protein
MGHFGRRRTRERTDRQNRESADRRHALALSTIDSAITAGCALRAPGRGKQRWVTPRRGRLS